MKRSSRAWRSSSLWALEIDEGWRAAVTRLPTSALERESENQS